MSNATIVCGWLFSAARVGGGAGGQNHATGDPIDAPSSVKHDAAPQGFLDAPRPPQDGFVPQLDAQVSQMPDAGPSGPFCSANAQCTTAGECCLTFGQPTGFCAPGTILFGVCTPFS